MPRRVVLLRGINIGPNNRIAMPALRELLGARGFGDVATYVQSGNIVLSSALEPDAVAAEVSSAIAEELGLQIAAVARSHPELAAVVAGNPFPEAPATNPKRFQVSFLDGQAPPDLQARLTELAAAGERVVVGEREIYMWTPEGVARSKLWAKLAAKGGLGKDVTATARNWTTVTALLDMVSGDG